MAAPTNPSTHAPVGRIVLTVAGVALILFGLVLGAVGTALAWAHATQREADGFFTTDDVPLETLGYAIVSDEIDLGTAPGGRARRLEFGDLATVRVTVDSRAEREVFVGIGPEDDVAAYLTGVAHAEITDVDVDPVRIGYRPVGGDAPPTPPGVQDFWAATAEGFGPTALEWDLESGQWAVVVMNADGSAGVAVDAAIGVRAGWVLAAGITLMVVGGLILVLGAVLLVVGAAGLARVAGRAPEPVGVSPVHVEGHLATDLSPWVWIVKAVLLIPHLVVLIVLWAALAVTSVLAWFAILFTGRYPRSIFDFNVGVLRWSWRVGFYSFSALATDRYPPFTLAPVDDYPARLQIAYPQELSRGLVLVKSWLLAIPHLVILSILVGGGDAARDGSPGGPPGLIIWLSLIAGVSLLFARRYPRGIFDFVMGCNRWVFRVVAYVALMTDVYPPFRLDQGGREPVDSEVIR